MLNTILHGSMVVSTVVGKVVSHWVLVVESFVVFPLAVVLCVDVLSFSVVVSTDVVL